MKRRHFLSLGTAGCLAAPRIFGQDEAAPNPPAAVDSAAGFAPDPHPRLLKEGGRTWLLDHEGNRLFALGLAITGRENRRSGREGGGGTPDRVSGDLAGGEVLKSLGLNSLIVPARPGLRPEGIERIVDVDVAPVSAMLPDDRIVFPDVFDAAVQQRIGNRIKGVCRRYREDPAVLGYCFTRDPLWDGRRARARLGTDWVSAIRSMKRDSPGKRVYLEYLKERYADAGTVATFYKTKAKDWDELLDDPFDAVPCEVGVVESNDRDFRKQIAAKFYGVVNEAVRAAAPEQLIFGDRFRFRQHPPEVFEAASQHVDVFCVEFVDPPEYDPFYFKVFEALVAKPVLVSCVRWPTASDGRGDAWAKMAEFYGNLARTESVVGIHAEPDPTEPSAADERWAELDALDGAGASPPAGSFWGSVAAACAAARAAFAPA